MKQQVKNITTSSNTNGHSTRNVETRSSNFGFLTQKICIRNLIHDYRTAGVSMVDVRLAPEAQLLMHKDPPPEAARASAVAMQVALRQKEQ